MYFSIFPNNQKNVKSCISDGHKLWEATSGHNGSQAVLWWIYWVYGEGLLFQLAWRKGKVYKSRKDVFVYTFPFLSLDPACTTLHTVRSNSLFFHRIGPLGRFDLVVAKSVHVWLADEFVCPLPMQFFLRVIR